MSDEDDPFERLEESVGDREGDPFEGFEDATGATGDSAGEGEGAGTGEEDGRGGDGEESRAGSDPWSEPGPGYDAHDVTPPGHRDELESEPASGDEADAADATSEAGKGEHAGGPAVPGGDTDGPTVRTDHGTGIDPDDPFGDVGTREGDPFDDDVFEEMDTGGLDPDDVWESLADAEERGSVSKLQDRIYAEVSKHRYCEQCEFFSDPPDVRCGHEGTEILEFVDNETVRVVDCPVVAERKELERHE